jgi:hypothetical protein
VGLRDKSPASSTGESSSGRMPATPRDGSELGINVSTIKGTPGVLDRRYRKRASVTFMEDSDPHNERERARREPERKDRERERERDKKERERKSRPSADDTHHGIEEKRRERRRSEARAAIEVRMSGLRRGLSARCLTVCLSILSWARLSTARAR